MRKFSARGTAFVIGPAELLLRLLMYAVPLAFFLEHGFATATAAALFFGLINGRYRLGCYTSHSLVADFEGLEITSGLSSQVIPWADVSAIQVWHRFNRVDFVAVHYFCAGRLAVATCGSRYAETESLAFVHACAHYVSSATRRPSIAAAGVCEQSVYRPLLQRLIQDVAAVTLIGALFRVAGPAFSLGVLAASSSALLATTRYSVRSTRLVWKDEAWCTVDGEAPPRAVPRALQLWVRCLAESRSAERVADLDSP